MNAIDMVQRYVTQSTTLFNNCLLCFLGAQNGLVDHERSTNYSKLNATHDDGMVLFALAKSLLPNRVKLQMNMDLEKMCTYYYVSC